MKIGLVIPAYNEEKRIAKTLKAYSDFFNSLKKKKIDYEILVSINNTKDNTKKIVSLFSKKNKKIKYIDLPKGGKGYAVIEGFKIMLKKDFDYIGFVDADLATSSEAFYSLIKNIENYDGVIASRYMKNSIVKPKQSIQRIISSRIYNFYIRAILLLNYKDTQCGAKLFKSNVIKKVVPKVTMSQLAFDSDLLYHIKKLGFKVKEHPTVWSDKEFSKVNFLKSGPLMALAILRLRLLNSPFHSLMRIYDKILNKLFAKNGK